MDKDLDIQVEEAMKAYWDSAVEDDSPTNSQPQPPSVTVSRE